MRLITPNRVIELSFTNSETNEIGLIKDSIINSTQLRWIQPMLGDDLWDLLDSESPNYSTVNQTLIDKLEEPMAFFVKYEVIPDSSINMTASGLQVLNPEYSNPATDKQRGEVRDTALIQGKTLLNEVRRWLELDANIVNYPLYSTANPNNDVTLRGGILL